jgi:hypothetical protein
MFPYENLLQLQNVVINMDETLCKQKGANLREQFTETIRKLLMKQSIYYGGVGTDLYTNSFVKEIDPALTDTQPNVYHVVC